MEPLVRTIVEAETQYFDSPLLLAGLAVAPLGGIWGLTLGETAPLHYRIAGISIKALV